MNYEEKSKVRQGRGVETENKEVWIDENNKILSFHEIENSKRVEMPEEYFWTWTMEIIMSGYRIM